MKKLFVFKGVAAHHVKVSHAGFVGLPSITGITGLNRNFAIQLAKELELSPAEFQPSGALLSIEGYHLHEGYKKGHKPGQAVYEAIPAAWASFTAHITLEIEAVTEGAAQKLAGSAVETLAQELLATMPLCKGALRDIPRPFTFESNGDARLEREQALQLLPAQSMVVVDYSYLVSEMRAQGLPLMEGLVATTLRHAKRPARYRQFFESESVCVQDYVLAPVMSGVLKLEASPSGQSMRPDALGNLQGSSVGSPTFTVARLQKAASLRLQMKECSEQSYAFWREDPYPQGYFCAAE